MKTQEKPQYRDVTGKVIPSFYETNYAIEQFKKNNEAYKLLCELDDKIHESDIWNMEFLKCEEGERDIIEAFKELLTNMQHRYINDNSVIYKNRRNDHKI